MAFFPYFCFPLIITPFYNRGKYIDVMSRDSAFTLAEEYIQEQGITKSLLGISIANSVPRISVPDFCADVPYSVISCRISEDDAVCQDDLPPIQIGSPIICNNGSSGGADDDKCQSQDDTGKIYANDKVYIDSNVPAFGSLECQNSLGVFVPSNGSIQSTQTNNVGGTRFWLQFQPCEEIPPAGRVYRFKACSACCNEEGETEQDCATVTFTIFPCDIGAISEPVEAVLMFDRPFCGIFPVCGGRAIRTEIYKSSTAITASVFSGDGFVLALPKEICKDFTKENLNFSCSDTSVEDFIISPFNDADIARLEGITVWFNTGFGMSDQFSEKDKYNFYSLVAYSKEPVCAVQFESTTKCGGTFSINLTINRFNCGGINIFNTDCTDVPGECTDDINDPGIPTIGPASNLDSITFATCEEYNGVWEILTVGDVVLHTSAVPDTFIYITSELLDSLNLDGIYKIRFTPYGELTPCGNECFFKVDV